MDRKDAENILRRRLEMLEARFNKHSKDEAEIAALKYFLENDEALSIQNQRKDLKRLQDANAVLKREAQVQTAEARKARLILSFDAIVVRLREGELMRVRNDQGVIRASIFNKHRIGTTRFVDLRTLRDGFPSGFFGQAVNNAITKVQEDK